MKIFSIGEMYKENHSCRVEVAAFLLRCKGGNSFKGVDTRKYFFSIWNGSLKVQGKIMVETSANSDKERTITKDEGCCWTMQNYVLIGDKRPFLWGTVNFIPIICWKKKKWRKEDSQEKQDSAMLSMIPWIVLYTYFTWILSNCFKKLVNYLQMIYIVSSAAIS